MIVLSCQTNECVHCLCTESMHQPNFVTPLAITALLSAEVASRR